MELKPCMNDLCIGKSQYVDNLGCKYYPKEFVLQCEKYQSEKPEPAWQVEAWERLKTIILTKTPVKNEYQKGIEDIDLFYLKIMQDIEQELKDDMP